MESVGRECLLDLVASTALFFQFGGFFLWVERLHFFLLLGICAPAVEISSLIKHKSSGVSNTKTRPIPLRPSTQISGPVSGAEAAAV